MTLKIVSSIVLFFALLLTFNQLFLLVRAGSEGFTVKQEKLFVKVDFLTALLWTAFYLMTELKI